MGTRVVECQREQDEQGLEEAKAELDYVKRQILETQEEIVAMDDGTAEVVEEVSRD